MRTSRVPATTSSTFRNQRPVIQVNDSAYQPGEQHQHDQQKHEPFKEVLIENKELQDTNVNKTVSTAPMEIVDDYQHQHTVQTGEDLDIAVKKIDELSKKQKRLQTYRSSI